MQRYSLPSDGLQGWDPSRHLAEVAVADQGWPSWWQQADGEHDLFMGGPAQWAAPLGDGTGSGQATAGADLPELAKARAAAVWSMWQQHWAAMGGYAALHAAQPPQGEQWPGAAQGLAGCYDEGDVTEKGLALMKRMTEDSDQGFSAATCAEAPASQGTLDTTAEAQDGDDIAQDIESAVRQFLSGDGDGLSDSDEDLDDVGGSSAPPDAARPAVAAWHSGAPPGLEAAAHPCVEAAEAADGPGAPADPAAAAPPPENVRDFLRVLRRRPLPACVAGEALPRVEALIAKVVLSLYRDRIRPVLNAVQCRLRERHDEAELQRGWLHGWGSPAARPEEPSPLPVDVVLQALLPICARDAERYWIWPPMKGQQPIILLLHTPSWFQGWVNVESSQSSYGQEVWTALKGYVQQEGSFLPYPPYQAALVLRRMKLPQLSELSLGELEHVVRLGLGSRLLYHCGDRLRHLPPAHASEATRAAPRAKPEDAAPRAQRPGDIADGQDLAVLLLQLLQLFPGGLPLSALKQKLYAHFRLNLNETAFNCSKLIEVFGLEPLKQIFPLEPRTEQQDVLIRLPNPADVPLTIWQRYCLQWPREPGSAYNMPHVVGPWLEAWGVSAPAEARSGGRPQGLCAGAA